MAEIFTPFLAAFILAYALRPICLWLESHKAPRMVAAGVSMVLGLGLAFFVLALFISLLRYEVPLIKNQLPIWIQNTQMWLNPQLETFHISLDWMELKANLLQKISMHLNDNADTLMASTFDKVVMSGGSVIASFVNAVLILFVSFYLLIDWDHFFKLLTDYIPPRFQETVKRLGLNTDELLSQYLRGQILVVAIMATFYSAGLSLIGMKGALALGVFTGLMIIIPYIGAALGFILSVLSALLQFGPGHEVILTISLFCCGQFLEGFILTPRLVGERIGLHPVAVLFALMLFGNLFGFFGILLALPISAVGLVLFKYFHSLYLQSSWYQK